ncbi:hypothetical protein [Neobacillus sp. 19]|uniref:hypothetical protein n=1 Tax=Neobacillus sp. 19 TaxID=3394458 RepID=UPI003BF75F0B
MSIPNNKLLTIYQPNILSGENGVRIQAEFEINGTIDVLWYEVESKYGQYLTYERLDGFLVGLLLYALKNEHDIQILGPVSESLFFQLKKYVIPLISQVYGYKPINIICDNLVSGNLESLNAVGTGLSCGIDSFSTVYENMVNEDIEKFKITHFTLFNVGSHRDFGGKEAENLFFERAIMARKCADELGKEFISVNSNISEILQLEFQPTHSFRSISAVLVLQKLFGVYYYSSSYHAKHFKLSNKDSAYYDIFNMSMLSTENSKFYSTCPTATRVEKTRMVAKYVPSHKYLNVCVHDGFNCGKCFKCTRTLLTLEIIGELDKFSHLFNIEAYESVRKKYIAKIIAYRDKDIFNQEISNEILKTNFRIPIYSKFAAFYLKIRDFIK